MGAQVKWMWTYSLSLGWGNLLLCAGVPNTTAITQEIDQSFGYFKSLLRDNLSKLTDNRLTADFGVSFAPSEIWLLVFGGEDSKTGTSKCQDSFAIAFLPARNKAAWAAVGAALLTCKCLQSDKVRHTTEDAPQFVLYQQIEEFNHNACQLLTVRGFDGNKLLVHFKKDAREHQAVTRPNSKAWVKLLLKSSSHGKRFTYKNRLHQTHEDTFCAEALRVHREQRP